MGAGSCTSATRTPSGRLGHALSASLVPVVRRYLAGIVTIAVLLQIAVIVRGAHAEPPVYTGVTSRLHSLTSITLTAREHADHPQLALVSAMVPWQALEPSDDSFDWSRLETDVLDARDNGYRLILRVMVGRAAPSWLGNVGVASIPLLGTDENAVDFCDHIRTSIPWDPILEAEYAEMMHELGRWLSRSDGNGKTNGSHVFLIPVSMPSILGTEMVYGYGPNVRCPAGTDAAGLDLASSNRAAWDRISTETDRRAWAAAAWTRAIDIHMRELPVGVRSVIAYGSVFGDGQAASMRIAQEQVPQYTGRLWGMYTNLQPEVAGDGSLSPWRDACVRCDGVIRQTVASGGRIGFQVAGGAVNDPMERFRYAVRDALANYPTMFIETSPVRIDQHEDFLLTGADPVQLQLAQLANPSTLRATQLQIRCEPGVVERPGTCTATVQDAGGDGATTPGGEGAIAWQTAAVGVFSESRCTPSGTDGTAACSVSYTPGQGSAGVHAITVAYAGDGAHAPSSADLELVAERRRSATSIVCGIATLPGSTTCAGSVVDVEAGKAMAPSGKVTFAIEGGVALGSCSLEVATDSKSRCSFDYVPSDLGIVNVVAEYAGGPDHAASVVSEPAPVAVEPAEVDTQSPTVMITRPLDGSTVRPRKLMITANSTDDVGVVAVVFAVNGQILCEDAAPNWTCSWRVPKEVGGIYTVTATAFDHAGNASISAVVVSWG